MNNEYTTIGDILKPVGGIIGLIVLILIGGLFSIPFGIASYQILYNTNDMPSISIIISLGYPTMIIFVIMFFTMLNIISKIDNIKLYRKSDNNKLEVTK